MPTLAPPLPPLPLTTSPVRSLWVRDNDVDPALDPRGTGLAAAAPEVLVEHVRERRITEVFLAAHGAGDGGAVDEWTARTCRVLRSRRTYVAALGGELDWLGPASDVDGGAPARWVRAALALGPFHRVHLDLAPWTHPDWDVRRPAVWASYLDALDDVRSAAAGVPLDVDVPWWFATTPDDDGVPLLQSVLARVARVVVLVDAIGVEDILGRLEPSMRSCEASGTGFAVGVVVGERGGAAAGRQQAGRDAAPTFHDLGTLDRTADVVRERMRGSTTYRSFAADGYPSWVALLEPHAVGRGAIPA